MSTQFTIGDLAKAADVPTTTLRFYERRGLVQPSGRTDANYRFYDEEAVERVRFIRAAQTSGFSLDDIEVLLDLSDQPRGSCSKVQSLIETRLKAVKQKLDDLTHVQSVLTSALRSCRKDDTERVCVVLNSLQSESKTKAKSGSQETGVKK